MSTPRSLSRYIPTQPDIRRSPKQHVAGAEDIPEPPQEADLSLALAGVAADAQVEDRPAGQRDDRPDPRRGEARPGDLVVGQRALAAVPRRVGHRDDRAVEEADAAALAQPAPVNPGIKVPAHETSHGGEEALGEPLPGLAVRPRLGAAGRHSPCGAIGDQPRDGGAAGLVGVEGLAEEDPGRHRRCVDPVVPGRLDLAEGLVEAIGGEDVGEREAALLEELAAEGFDLMAGVTVGGQSHRSAPGW